MDKNNSWQWRKEQIRALRDRLTLTLEEMAVLVGVSVRTIFRWEKGVSQPRRKAVRRLADIERKLITQESKEKKRRARPLPHKKYRDQRLRIRKEMEVIRREVAKVLEASWKKLQQTGGYNRK